MAAAVFSTDLTEILTQVAEAAAGIAAIYNGFKILDLAKNYYKLYEEQRTFYYNTFQQGLEAPFANEVYMDPIPVLDYAGRVSTAYNVATGPFGGRAGDADAWWLRHANAYGSIRASGLIKELVLDTQRVKSDWTNYLFRFEESYYDTRLDIRWRKRLALHNIGIKEGTAVSSSMADALGAYQGHIQDFTNQLATYGNGIAKYVGYQKGLSDTSDDFNKLDFKPPTSVPDYNYVQVGMQS